MTIEGTKRAAIVAAAEAYAKMEGIELDKVYIWFDLACVEQDDLAELVRGVNALGLYITACDAFVSRSTTRSTGVARGASWSRNSPAAPA